MLASKTKESEGLFGEVTGLKAKLAECMSAASGMSSLVIDRSTYDDLMTNYDLLLAENTSLKTTNAELKEKMTKHVCSPTPEAKVPWLNNVINKAGLGYKKKKKVDWSKSKYVGLKCWIVCSHCGQTGHKRFECDKLEHDRNKSVMHAKNN